MDKLYLKDYQNFVSQFNMVGSNVLFLRNDDKIDSFEVECESLESIHNHSAWAYQSEG